MMLKLGSGEVSGPISGLLGREEREWMERRGNGWRGEGTMERRGNGWRGEWAAAQEGQGGLNALLDPGTKLVAV